MRIIDQEEAKALLQNAQCEGTSWERDDDCIESQAGGVVAHIAHYQNLNTVRRLNASFSAAEGELLAAAPDLARTVIMLHAQLALARHQSEGRIMENAADLLRFFDYKHLPPDLQAVSAPFAGLAYTVAEGPDDPEMRMALRKLLEAKDCAVRAHIAQRDALRARE